MRSCSDDPDAKDSTGVVYPMTEQLPDVKGYKPSLPSAFEGEIYQQVGKYARSAVLYAFHQIGGSERLSDWAHDNPDDFFTKLFPKIIARESEVTHHKTVDQLADLLDGDYTIEDAVEIDPSDPPVFDRTLIAASWQTEPQTMPYGIDPVDLVDFDE